MNSAKNIWYNEGVPVNYEKKDIGAATRISESMKREIDRIAEEHDRTPGYIIRELMTRGLSLYELDGRLKGEPSAAKSPSLPLTNGDRPKTIPELVAALESIGVEMPQFYGGLPDDPDGEGFAEIIERIWLDIELVTNRLAKGKKINYNPTPITISEEVDGVSNTQTVVKIKTK